jgi:hypothetical protein
MIIKRKRKARRKRFIDKSKTIFPYSIPPAYSSAV